MAILCINLRCINDSFSIALSSSKCFLSCKQHLCRPLFFRINDCSYKSSIYCFGMEEEVIPFEEDHQNSPNWSGHKALSFYIVQIGKSPSWLRSNAILFKLPIQQLCRCMPHACNLGLYTKPTEKSRLGNNSLCDVLSFRIKHSSNLLGFMHPQFAFRHEVSLKIQFG